MPAKKQPCKVAPIRNIFQALDLGSSDEEKHDTVNIVLPVSLKKSVEERCDVGTSTIANIPTTGLIPQELDWEKDTVTKKKLKTKARKQRQEERGGPILEPEEKEQNVVMLKGRDEVADSRDEPLGNTILHHAVIIRNVKNVTALLNRSRDLVNNQNMFGDTPLDLCEDIVHCELTRKHSQYDVSASPEIAQLIIDAGGTRNLQIIDVSEHVSELLTPYFPKVVAVVIAAYSKRNDHPLFIKPFGLWTGFKTRDPRRPLPKENSDGKKQVPWKVKIQFLTPHSVLQQISVTDTIFNDLCFYRRGSWSYEEAGTSIDETKSYFDVKIKWLTEWWKGVHKTSYSLYDPAVGEYESIDDIIVTSRVQRIKLTCEPRIVPQPPDNVWRMGSLILCKDFLVTGTTTEPVNTWAHLPPFEVVPPIPCIYADNPNQFGDPEPAWCLAPWTLVVMTDGCLRRADELRPGDTVMSENNLSTTIECVVTMSGLSDCTKPLVSLASNIIVTAGHPVKPPKSYRTCSKLLENVWYRPHDVAPQILCSVARLFNFVTSSRGSVLLTSNNCEEPWIASTLGQFCDGIDNSQSFFGTERIVETLRGNKGWPLVAFTNQW